MLFVCVIFVGCRGGKDQLWFSNRRADVYCEQHPLLICAFPLSCRVIYNYTVSLVSQRAVIGKRVYFLCPMYYPIYGGMLACLLIKSTPALLLIVPTASTMLFYSTSIERALYSIVNTGFFPSKTRKNLLSIENVL